MLKLLRSRQIVGNEGILKTMQVEVLHELSVMMMVSCVDSTSLLSRTTLQAMVMFGTRIRTLFCGCILGASLCCLVMSHTAVVLIMISVAEKLVQTLQNDIIQVSR